MRRAYAEVPSGQIHYVEAGTGDPVLLLHQTPRSWTEFRYVLPLLGRTHRAIAMDTLGFGESSPPRINGVESIEFYAAGVIELLDALGIEKASLVGHHTGGIIAVEVAACYPDRVDRLVLSCTPLVDEEGRLGRPKVDHAPVQQDGGHLVDLWRARQPYYPDGRPDLLEAFIIDALKAGTRRFEGHEAVARYEMEHRLPHLKCPVLLVGAPGDNTYVDLPRWAAALPSSRSVKIDGGMVPLPDHLPEQFTSCVQEFLAE
ncbi:alpha/beta hydrolase [Streptomyces sp. NBC_01643]|uniref:alpha/beta fold hydrolase n=1 Tax=Streptomyces sp. NBC_01643 TaxID=2975906 RepID=UPI002F91ACC3|nr:alpha/beta hydrolase [Streptomyces sp. NBC_01643]